MPSNSLPDADLSLPEMKTKSPSCPSGGIHMYARVTIKLEPVFIKHYVPNSLPLTVNSHHVLV